MSGQKHTAKPTEGSDRNKQITSPPSADGVCQIEIIRLHYSPYETELNNLKLKLHSVSPGCQRQALAHFFGHKKWI